MSEYNIIDSIVYPESPKVTPNEVYYIYVPKAGYDNEGIASYNILHFTVENGVVSIDQSIIDDINYSKNKIGEGELVTEADTLVLAISELLEKINTNSDSISKNSDDIKTNAESIKTNAEDIESNKDNISSNLELIKSNSNKISSNTESISDNRNLIYVNIQNISKNAQDIQYNRTEIGNNASAILYLRKDLTNRGAQIDGLLSITGNTPLQTYSKQITLAINELYEKCKRTEDNSSLNGANIANLQAQVRGIGRSYVLNNFSDFMSFINGHLSITISEDRNADGNPEVYEITVYDIKTGDNILLVEHNVPDFWFEKNPNLLSFETYNYKGTTYELSVRQYGAVVGGMHIAETDYTVIEQHALSAGQYANEAKQSANDAKESETKIMEVVDSLYENQIAPPYHEIENSVFLATPTYDML